MMVTKEHIFAKLKQLRDYYGIWIMLIYCFTVVVFALIVKDNIYVSLTDNMDSNIPIYKMIKDNGLFWKFNESLPFLGGVLPRSQYRVELSVQSWIYMLFPTLAAYYAIYILKILLSGLGFYILADKLKKYGDLPYTDRNIWCLIGLVYGMIGNWPHAALGFASLPWWVLIFYLLYKTQNIKYIPVLLIFVLTTSFTMLALFSMCYTILFIIYTCIKEHKFQIRLTGGLLLLMAGYVSANSHHVWQGLNSSAWTIKSLKSTTYTESVWESLSKFKNAFLFLNSYYHTGGSVLRYFVIPVCSAFGIWFFVAFMRKKMDKRIFVLYITIYAAIILNAFACCLDNNYLFRKLLPFASGFVFSRFAWISPFFWSILFAIVCCYIEKKIIGYIFIFISTLVIIFDPCYDVRNSMYNELYCNVTALLGNESFKDSNHEWTWHEYYSEELFEQIKEDIGYDGSWSIAYGIEPSVLQYNGIKTLDGYFTNYSLEYHDKFYQLIQPELNMDEHHAEYWNYSAGARAYIWSPLWDFVLEKTTQIKSADLYIDIDVFKEMGGKYIFSRLEITNAGELGLSCIGIWELEYKSPYIVYVYEAEAALNE